MKKHRTLLLAGLIAFVVLFVVLSKKSPTSVSQDEQVAAQVEPKKQNVTSTRLKPADLNSLIREVRAEAPRKANDAGHIIIASANTSDAEATDALLRSFARGEAHLNHMRRENAFVTRRQIVELPETFTELGDRIKNGDQVTTITIPDFDGSTFEMKYNPRLMGPAGDGNGTLLGKIPAHDHSDVILGYYKGSTSGYVNLPVENRVLEYMTVGGKQIVVKEIDLAARNEAEPCHICTQANGSSDHPAGNAHHIATGLGQHTAP